MTGPRALPDDDLCSSPIGPSLALAATFAIAAASSVVVGGYVIAAHLWDRLHPPTKETP